MLTYLLKGILIGLLFGLPVGAVGTMTVQRTYSFGFKAGLLTGLGSSVADCLYAIVGAFGLTLISDFLLRYQLVIHVLGGGLVLLMGIQLIVKTEEAQMRATKAVTGVKMFISSFAIGITNPAAILTFLFAFSYFGIANVDKVLDAVLLVSGVFVGTYIWWTVLCSATCFIKSKAKHQHVWSMNRLFGIILTAFGAVVLMQSFIK